MITRGLLAGLLVPLLWGCGSSDPAPRPAPLREGPDASRSAAVDSGTDLPPDRPSPFELDLRRRTDDGDDLVLKLTEGGARYGVARGKARVALRYRSAPEALEEVYATLRDEGFDRIETEPRASGPTSGSSIRVKAGPAHFSVSAMGRMAPTKQWADAYARTAAAAEALLPRGKSETVVVVQWDPSVGDRAAALDVDLGEDLVGVHRRPGPRPDVELHLARARPLEMLLRTGSPPTSTPLTIEAGRDRGVRVVYDEAESTLVLRPSLDAEPAAQPSP